MAQIVLGDIDLIGGIDGRKASGQEGDGETSKLVKVYADQGRRKWSDRSIGLAAVAGRAHAGPRLPALRRPPGREGGWHEIHVCGRDGDDGAHMRERSYACQGLHCQVTWWTRPWIVEPSLCGVGGCRRHRDAGERAAVGDLGEHSSLRRARNGQEGGQERSRQRHSHQGKGSSSRASSQFAPGQAQCVAPSHKPDPLSTSARAACPIRVVGGQHVRVDRDLSGDESETKSGVCR